MLSQRSPSRGAPDWWVGAGLQGLAVEGCGRRKRWRGGYPSCQGHPAWIEALPLKGVLIDASLNMEGCCVDHVALKRIHLDEQT